ncbi:MAG: hypothetical protein LIV24_12005, partial [Eubacterium sp.]|nr:hypothetical protein [Eubacterium sp.]
MKYHLNKTNYHDFSVFEKHKLPGRSYFIPYPDRATADAVMAKKKRYSSPKVICLNGDWDFRFYPDPKDLPDVLDTDHTAFDTIDVPSCWQFRGYDQPFYVNVRYQFPCKPPVIPEEDKVGRVFSWIGGDQGIGFRYKDPGEQYNFVGVFRKMITIDDTGKNNILSFLGVASCMDLYLNGTFIGYSEGSHNTAEFDLSGKLQKGRNELLVVVHRWCNGTYLEDQDMFRNNGIFRDVLLRVSDPCDFWDFKVTTAKHGSSYSLSVDIQTFADTEVEVTLEGPLKPLLPTGAKAGTSDLTPSENNEQPQQHNIPSGMTTHKDTAQTISCRASITFENLSVQEWNAEYPVLYNLYLETPGSCIREKIGFRTVTIDKDVFLVNGHPVKLHGVNHHDTTATNGYTMTPDEIEQDIRNCKAFNFDTIRTSHYPPDPLLLELADEYGIYIIDENDLEAHGSFAHLFPPTYNTISNDPRWASHYVDRVTRLYERDKNHPSIIMWSLGNEAGGDFCMDAEYTFLKKHSDLPVHYESCIHSRRQAYDVGSEMYPPVDKVHAAGEKRRKQTRLNDRPYFLCEYAHAMGVGPGNAEAYWEEIYRYDNLMGGCVWEMNDHAVLEKEKADTSPASWKRLDYTYGGDHGEWEHDKNFCVDGLFYPDRHPSTGAWIMRYIYRPIRVRFLGGNRIEIFNTTGFTEGARYRLTFRWNDGSEDIVIPNAGPLSRETRSIHIGEPVDGNIRAIVTSEDRLTGRQVSEEELLVRIFVPGIREEDKTALPDSFRVTGGHVRITLPDGSLLRSDAEYTLLYRADTDNDWNMNYHNTMLPWQKQTEQYLSTETVPHGVRVTTRISNPKGIFIVTDTYEGTKKGILVTSTLHPVKRLPVEWTSVNAEWTSENGKPVKKILSGSTHPAIYIPRFGKCFYLDRRYDDVIYMGRTGESYADMKEQFPIDTVHCTVDAMTEPN